MKNRTIAIGAGSVVAAFALIACSWNFAIGQRTPPSSRTLEGTWLVEVTPRNCQTGEALAPPFNAVLTFNSGGTMSGDSTTVSPALKTASYGVWAREHGWREYSFAFVFFRHTPAGTYDGMQRVRQTLSLSNSGNEFTTTGTFQFDRVSGSPITGCTTSTGVRFE